MFFYARNIIQLDTSIMTQQDQVVLLHEVSELVNGPLYQKNGGKIVSSLHNINIIPFPTYPNILDLKF